MKLSKILSMLLALCMILCCFAACGSSDKNEDEAEDKKSDEKATVEVDIGSEEDDDKKAEEEETEKNDSNKGEETEEVLQDAVAADKEDELEGKWIFGASISRVIYDKSGISVEEDMFFSSLYTFDGEGGYKFEPFGGFEAVAYESYISAYCEATIEWYKDQYNVDYAGLKEYVENSDEFASMKEFEEWIYEKCSDDVYLFADLFDEYGSGTYEYDNDTLVFDGDVEYKISFGSSDVFVITECEDVPIFVGCEFTRQ